MPSSSGTTATLTAGLTRETLAALQAAQADKQPSFLIVPPSEPSSASLRSAGAEPLPQVWQDLFACTRSAQSDAYLDSLAARPPLLPPIGLRPHGGQCGGACRSDEPGADGGSAAAAAAQPEDAAEAAEAAAASAPAEAAEPGHGPAPGDDPTLGISRDTLFASYLSPEALVQRHRLGRAEVRRLYQALQVYSLAFHQTMLEATAHATNKGLLLLALWRGFAMLWDAALQVVFPAETVQQSRERQAALLTGEHLLEQLGEERSRSAALERENAALRQQVEGAVVQMLSVQVDAAVAQQSVGGLQAQLRAAQQERGALQAQAAAARRDLLLLQDKVAALSGPQDELYRRAQQLERALKEKQTQLSVAAKQAADALAGKDEAQQAARAERLRREAAEQRAEQLQESLNAATLQLRAAQAAAAAREQQDSADAAARKQREDAESAAREDDTARLATERAGAEQRAAAAEAQAAALRQQLEAAQAQLAAEQQRGEELVGLLYPLTAKLKALEAAQAAGG